MSILIKSVRTYTLRIYGTGRKFDDLRWSAYQFTKLTNAFIEHLYFNDSIKYYSTKGFGKLGNQAQQKALSIVSSKKSNERENKHKKGLPFLKKQLCYAVICKRKSKKGFNYRIKFAFGFVGKSSPRYLFAKRTRLLKKVLRDHWKLSDQCEIFFEPTDGHWYVRVFVSKEVAIATPKEKSIGIDVGVNHIIATNEGDHGYQGNSLKKRLKKLEQAGRERQRQLSLAKNRKQTELVEKLQKNLAKNKKKKKSVISQLLDKEAKRIVARGQATSSNLVVEDPKVLANLRGIGSLKRWAKTKFARQLQRLGKERGVFVIFQNPAYSSRTCPKCGSKDKQNRVKERFLCVQCGHAAHADVNAAVNLSLWGQDAVDRGVFDKKKRLVAVKAP